MDVSDLRGLLMTHGQSHLLHHWDSLNPKQKQCLYNELRSIDYETVIESFNEAIGASDDGKVDDAISPIPPSICCDPSSCSKTTLDSYHRTGYNAISAGEVGVILLAGGQGTRLGVSYPKGMYNVGLTSGKSLYQIQAERILRIQSLAEEVTGESGKITWLTIFLIGEGCASYTISRLYESLKIVNHTENRYIMTSEHTKDATRSFFEKQNYFGLDASNVVLFEQHQLPAFTLDGKIILSRPDKVSLSPDGNGGLYSTVKGDVLNDMEHRGIRYLYVYCVDNILVRVADPSFLGFCIQRTLDCAAVVVEKNDPKERVGVVCKVGGVYQVVEYSEISLKTAERRNSDGSLTYSHGNICNHFFTLPFLHSCAIKNECNLRHHIAKKKVPYVTETGTIVNPSTPNAIKMEKFVFDVFQFATNFGIWVQDRDTGFSPLKNADGAAKDTPTTCRQALYSLHLKYITQAGGTVVSKEGTPYSNDLIESSGSLKNGNNNDMESKNCDFICEISPLVSYTGEGLEDLCKDKTFITPTTFERDATEHVVITHGYQNQDVRH